MYKLVNKVTFMIIDTVKDIIKNNKKLINTTSLSDNQIILVQWQHISTTMFISYVKKYNIVTYKNQQQKNKNS